MSSANSNSLDEDAAEQTSASDIVDTNDATSDTASCDTKAVQDVELKSNADAVVDGGSQNPEVSPKGSASAMATAIPSGQRKLNLQMELLNMMDMSNVGGAIKTTQEAKKKEFLFWQTQPVKWFDDVTSSNEAVEPDKTDDQLRKDPYSLPAGFNWDLIDIHNDGQLEELYKLLNENYVEDDDNMFRFDYSPEFLRWALTPPGWTANWHCGVRVTKSKKLIGFIAAIPSTLRIYDVEKKMVEINFLCVHKKLRAKRVAPVLIKEITRRVNLVGIFQAVYTAGRVLPTPIGTCRYWHRSLNPKKLVEVKFSHLAKNMTIQRMGKLYKLPSRPVHSGFRPMTSVDISDAFALLSQYLKKFAICPIYSLEEFEHWFIPRPNVVDSYVVEESGKIVDFVSFYTLPSTVMHHPTYKSLKAAYAFYNVATSMSWTELMQDALIVAKNNNYDVFNALDLMDNAEFLEPLKFGIGDGNLQYYIYNWRCPEMTAAKIGLVLQ